MSKQKKRYTYLQPSPAPGEAVLRLMLVPLLLMLIPMISALIATGFLVHYQYEYKVADAEYKELAEQYALDTEDIDKTINIIVKNEEKVPISSVEEVITTPTSREAKEQIDFRSLIAENPDVTAWITIPSCNINYPVVKGTDNEKYLNTTYQGKNNAAGAIFMDYNNSSDFNDMHTLIYGHNMKDNSMFGSLKKMRNDPTMLQDNPYFYIFLPDGHMRQYEIFSVRIVSADSTAYRIFDDLTEYREYINECIGTSKIKLDTDSNLDSGLPVITLSTCSGDNDRFIVHGVLHAIF